MKFNDFKKGISFSLEDMCSQYFRGKSGTIKVKKEHVAVKNLAAIINATLNLSIQKGFQEMSLRDLCSESGLSMGALYSYIKSKDDLVSMIHDVGHITITRVMDETIDPQLQPDIKLFKAIQTHLYLSELMQQWFYFFFMETKNLKKQDHRKPIRSELKTEEFFLDILKEGAEAGKFSDTNILLTASSIKAMLQDWYLKRWKYKERNISVEAYADFINDFVISYIRKKS